MSALRSGPAGCGRASRPESHAHARAVLDVSSKCSILSFLTMVSPMSSRPLSRQCLRCASISNLTTPPSGPRISCFSQIDRQRGVGAALGVVEQLLQVLRRDLDRQHAVLEAVVVEDVAERGRDHAADAEIHQRPGRVLARGAAAEIVAGDQDLGLAIGRLVEHEVGVLAAVVAGSASPRTGPMPSPVRLMVLRYCLGMIMSVSTLIILSGAATPSSVVNLSIISH